MLLHSDIARLVLGYLAQENLNQSYTTFLNESPHLQSIKHLLQGPSSMYVSTLNIFGKTLCIILDEYSTMKETEATYLRSHRNEGQKTHITQLWEKLEESITALRSHQIASLVDQQSHPDNELAPIHPVTTPNLRRMSPFRAGSRNKVTRLVLKNVGRRVRSKIRPLLPSQIIQNIDAQQTSRIPLVTQANQVFSAPDTNVHASSAPSLDINTPLPTMSTTKPSNGVFSAPSSVEQSRRQKAKRAPKRLSDVERRVIERDLNDDPGEALLQHVTNNQTEVMSVVGATIMQQIKNCAQATNSPAESRLSNSRLTPTFSCLDADIAKHNQDAIASMTLESLLETDFLKPDKEFARELEGMLTSPKEQCTAESIDVASPPSAARLSFSPPFLSPSTASVNLSSDTSPSLRSTASSVAMPTTSYRSPGNFPTIVDVTSSLSDAGADVDMTLTSAFTDNVASDLEKQPLQNTERPSNGSDSDYGNSQEENRTSPTPLNRHSSSKSPLLQSARAETLSVSASLDSESTNTNAENALTSVSSKVSKQSSDIMADPPTTKKSTDDQDSGEKSDKSTDVSFEGPNSLQIQIDLNTSDTEDDYLPSLQEVLGNKTSKSSGGYFHLGKTNRRQQPSAAKSDRQVTNTDKTLDNNLTDLDNTAGSRLGDAMEINHVTSPNISPAKPTQTNLNSINNIHLFECPSSPKSTEKEFPPDQTIPDIVQRSPAKCTRSQVRAHELPDLNLPPRSLSAEKGKTPKIRIKSARSCLRERKEKRRSLENKKDSSGEKDKGTTLLPKEVGKTKPCSVVIDTKSDMTWMIGASKEATSQVVTSLRKTPNKSKKKQTGRRTPQNKSSPDPPSSDISSSPEQTILEVVKLRATTSCESEEEPFKEHGSPRKLTLRYGLRAVDPGSDTSASQLVIDTSSDHEDAERNKKTSTAGNKHELNVVDITAPDSDNSKQGEGSCTEDAARTTVPELSTYPNNTEPHANLNSSIIKPPSTKDGADLRQEHKELPASSYYNAPCSPYVGRTVQVDEQGVESAAEAVVHPSDDESTLRASDVEIDDLVLDERDEIAKATEASASEKVPFNCVEIPIENAPSKGGGTTTENSLSNHDENQHVIPPSNPVEISPESTTLNRLEIPHETTALNQVEIPLTTSDCDEIPKITVPSNPFEIQTEKPPSNNPKVLPENTPLNNVQTPTDITQSVHFSSVEVPHSISNPSVMRQSAIVRVPKGDKGIGMQDIINRLVNQVRATTRKVLPGDGENSIVTVQLDGNGARPGVTTTPSRPTLVDPRPQCVTAVSSSSNGVMLGSEALVSNLCSEEVTGESLTLLLNETSLTQMVAAAKQLNPPAQNAADEKALVSLEPSSTTAAFSTISPHTGIFSVFGDDEKRATASSESLQPHTVATPGLISWLNTSVPPSTHHGTPVAPIAARRNLDFNSGNPHHPHTHPQVISTPGYYSNVSPAYEGNKKPRYRKLLPKTYPGFSGSGIDPVSIRPDTIKLDLPEGAVVRDLEVQDSKIANRYSSFNPPRQHTVKSISLVGQPINVSQTIRLQPKPTNQKAAHFQPITLPSSAQQSLVQTTKLQPIPAKKTIFSHQTNAIPDSAESPLTQRSKSQSKPINNTEVASTVPQPIAVINSRLEQQDQSQSKSANQELESNPPIAAPDAGHVPQAQSEPANQEADSTSEKAPNLRKSDRLRKKHKNRAIHCNEGDPYVYTSAIPASLIAAQGDDSVSSSIDVAPSLSSKPAEDKPQEIASTVQETPSEIEPTLSSKNAKETDADSNRVSSPTKTQSTSAPSKKSKSSKKPPKGKSLDSSGTKDSEAKSKKKKKKKRSSKAKDETPSVNPDQENIVLQYLQEEEAKISSPEEGELRILESPIAEARVEKQEKDDISKEKSTAVKTKKHHSKKRKKSLDHEERVARKRKKLMRSLNNVTNEELAEILTFVHGRDGSTTPLSPDNQGTGTSPSGRSDELLRLLSEKQEPKSSRRKRTEPTEKASEVSAHKVEDFVAERLEVKESPSMFRFPPPPKTCDSNAEKSRDASDAALSESSRTADSNFFGDDSNTTFKLPIVSSPCSAEVSLASERGGVKQQQKQQQQQQQRSARRGKKLKRRISLTRVPISPSKLGASPLHLRTPSPALVCRDSPDTVNLVAESLLELSRSHDADVETPQAAVTVVKNNVRSEDEFVASKENVRVVDLAQNQSSRKEHKNRDRKTSDSAKEVTPSSEKKSNKKKHKKRKDILDKLDISKFLSKVHYE